MNYGGALAGASYCARERDNQLMAGRLGNALQDIFSAASCCWSWGAWFQSRLDRKCDAGFRAGQNSEAEGWEYL